MENLIMKLDAVSMEMVALTQSRVSPNLAMKKEKQLEEISWRTLDV